MADAEGQPVQKIYCLPGYERHEAWLRSLGDSVSLIQSVVPETGVTEPALVADDRGLALVSPALPTWFRIPSRRLQPRPDLLKACGHPRDLRILDACAGFGTDAVALAEHNDVTCVEVKPTVWLLLGDFLHRHTALNAPRCGDAREVMQNERWDLIYLDPMFPARRKKALPNISAQVLRLLTEEQRADDAGLLRCALDTGTRRVVLKRRLKDPVLLSPSSQVRGRTVRFDVYVRF